MALEVKRKPRSGRRELISVASLGGALVVPSIASLLTDRDGVVASSVPVGLALGLTASYIGVPRQIPVGTSSYLIGATSIGSFAGFTLAAELACRRPAEVMGVNCDTGVIITGALAGGVIGLATSVATARRLDLSAGDAALINSGAIWGSIAGALLWASFDGTPGIGAPLILSGLGLGTLTGAILTRRADISRRHMTLIDVSGALGMAVIVSVASVTVLEGRDSGSSDASVALLGAALGLIAGTYITRNMDAPVSLSSVAPSVGAAREADGKTIMTLGFSGGF